jgi:urea transporter
MTWAERHGGQGARAWDRLTDDNWMIRFIDTLLRGAGQVLFQDNPVSGLFIVGGVTWGAVRASTPDVAIGVVVALIVSTVTAIILGLEEHPLRIGLYGYNGLLVGAAVPTFLHSSPMVWVYIVVGAAVSTVVMLATSQVFKTWGVAALTFPFVLTTWFLLLGSYQFARTRIESLPAPSLPIETTKTLGHVTINLSFLLETIFRNISQVFLINNWISGILILIGILASSRWSGWFALIGSGVALASALLLSAPGAAISAGLFGFSGVLTGIALGSVFYVPGWKVLGYTVLGVIFTVIVQGAFDTAVTPIGIPALTAPFVLTTWLFLLAKQKFEPVEHVVIEGGVAQKSASKALATSGFARARLGMRRVEPLLNSEHEGR